MSGPLSGALLFSLNVTVIGFGVSVFSFDRAHLINQGPYPLFPNPQFIPIVTLDGVFGNSGVVAFFNTLPTNPPAILPGQNVNFTSRASFSFSGAPISSFKWNFGDPTPEQNVTTLSILHAFRSPGRYQVGLTVADAQHGVGSITRVVVVDSALGGLDLTVKDQRGTGRGGVLVQVANLTLPSQSFNKTSDRSGGVSFRDLQPGQYIVRFSGGSLQRADGKTEKVSAGLVSQDTLYLAFVDAPLQAGPSDFGAIIFFGSVLGGVGVLGVAVVMKKRNSGRQADSAKGLRLKRSKG